MKIKITFIFLLLIAMLPAQAVKLSVTLTDAYTSPHTRTLYFGVDPDGTDGIDTQFEESDLPPLPPSGAFDVRLKLPDGVLSSFIDIRNADTFPYTGTKTYTIGYQWDEHGTPTTISWDLPAEVSGTITDAFGGVIFSAAMSGNGSAVVTNTFLTQLIMTINYNNILPVELTSFSASYINQYINLNWKTATEVNNFGFDIERSSNKKEWEKIGFVNGKGNNSSITEYSYVDKSPLPAEKSYYRLKQIDIDGKKEYSEIIEIIKNKVSDYKLFDNYPNPFNPSTNIKFSLPENSNVVLDIYNAIGEKVERLINENLSAGTHLYNWNAKGFASGIYYYSVTAGNFHSVKKMILIK